MEMSKEVIMKGEEEEEVSEAVSNGGTKSFSSSASLSTPRNSEEDPARDSVAEENVPGDEQFRQLLPWPLPPLQIPYMRPEACSHDVERDSSFMRHASHGARVAYYVGECSKVSDYIYLGSDWAARKKEVLQQNGITHVLNCVGFVCPEYFKNDFVYKTLWLYDDSEEDITSILYDVFDFFEDVCQQGGRVFVHCHQGISRSPSLVIAYMMWREGWSFGDAFHYVKAARDIASPNMGFTFQLLECQDRLHGKPLSPSSGLRMYKMAPHSPYDSLYLVPKMLNDPSPTGLDSRGAFIIHVLSSIFVWIGQRCEPVMENDAISAASQVVRYEQFQGPILVVKEGDEPLDFWEAFSCAPVSLDGRKIDKEQIELGAEITKVNKRVDEYDVDFGLFFKALAGGVVPPLSSPGLEHETLLPARGSNWSILRQKFTSNYHSIHSDSALARSMTCAH